MLCDCLELDCRDCNPPRIPWMTEPTCTCTELQVATVCHDFRNEPHVVGCPRWGRRKKES